MDPGRSQLSSLPQQSKTVQILTGRVKCICARILILLDFLTTNQRQDANKGPGRSITSQDPFERPTEQTAKAVEASLGEPSSDTETEDLTDSGEQKLSTPFYEGGPGDDPATVRPSTSSKVQTPPQSPFNPEFAPIPIEKELRAAPAPAAHFGGAHTKIGKLPIRECKTGHKTPDTPNRSPSIFGRTIRTFSSSSNKSR